MKKSLNALIHEQWLFNMSWFIARDGFKHAQKIFPHEIIYAKTFSAVSTPARNSLYIARNHQHTFCEYPGIKLC